MRLSRRENTLIGLAAIILCALALYFLVIEPLAARRDKLERLTARLEADLVEMRVLAAEYRTIAERRAILQGRVRARSSDFAPFSYLENLAREAGLTGKIESMTPVAASTEEGKAAWEEFDVRLTGIGLLELVRFLYRLEASDKAFFVVNLNVRPRYLKPSFLDVNLRLATPAAS